MAGQDPIMYDYQALQTAFQTVKQFGEQVGKLGTSLTKVHDALAEHCSGDESGVGAVIAGAAKDVSGAAGKVFTEGGRVLSEMGTRGKTNGQRTQHTDETVADAFHSVHDNTYGDRPGVGTDGSSSRGEPRTGQGGGTEPGGPDPVSQKGVGPCGKAGEPVDVVEGRLVDADVDVDLPGVLPLILRRAYSSGYKHGRLFGPGYASTLDIRIQISRDEILYLDDDARVVSFPVPSSTGERVSADTGPRLVLSWDRERDVVTVLDRDLRTTYEFDGSASGRAEGGGAERPLTAICDRAGNRIGIDRDRDGLPLEVRHFAGYRVVVETSYVRVGWRVEGLRLIAAPSGPVPDGGTVLRQFGYDAGGRLAEVADEAGNATTYTVDALDRVTSWTDRSGYRFGYVYDEQGRVARTEGDGGFLSGSFAYDPGQQVTVYTDSLGASTEYHYDQRGNIVREVDALGAATVSAYDRHDLLVSVKDPLGAATGYERDNRGEVTRVIRADGTTIAFEVDEYGDIHSITGPDGARWECRYDEHGNLTAEIDPAGATTTYAYAEDGPTGGIGGRLAAVTDVLGAVTAFETDRAGLPVAITDPNGGVWRTERTARGMATAVTDPLGNATVTSFDPRDLPVRRTGPDGAAETWEYDDAQNLVAHTDAVGNTTRFEYGPFRKTTARTSPDGARYTFHYDTELKLAAVTNPGDLTWSYARDAIGRITAESDFNGRRLEYLLDAAGRVARRVNGAGETVDIERDVFGRIVAQRTAQGRLAAFGYDPAGRLISARNSASLLELKHDRLGRVVAEVLNGRGVGSEYDALGRRVKRTTPSGRESTWGFDAAGNVARLATPGGQVAFDYDGAGRETARRIGASAALTQAYDRNGRLIARQLLAADLPGPGSTAQAASWRTVSAQSWTYRADGTPATAADSRTGTRRFSLDARGRIVDVTAEGWSESYAYDANGNLQQASDTRRPDQETAGERENVGTLQRRAGRTTFEYDAQHRVAARTVRTLSGQRATTRFGYDPSDRMIRAELPDGCVWEYFYDALGRRFSKRRLDAQGRPVEETRFAWDGMNLAEQEHARHDDPLVTYTGWDHQPGTFTPVSQHRRRLRRDSPQDEIDHEFHAIVTDLVGAPVELVDETGRIAWHTYRSVWGARVADAVEPGSDLDCPLRFPGQYHDAETGLDYNNQRYYDPETARYTTADPLGLAASPNDYAYVDNPLTLLDPLGLTCTDDPGQKVSYDDETNPLVKAVHDQRKADAKAKGLTYGKGGTYGSARLDDGTIITGRSRGKGSRGTHAEEDLISQAQNRGKTITDIYSERAPCANKCRDLVKNFNSSWSYEWNGIDKTTTEDIRDNSNSLLKSAINKLFGG